MPEGESHDVFGAWMFSGKFAEQSFTGFNPDYLLGVGDVITLKLWGAYELEQQTIVDAQGNIFIPRVGPVRVLNVRNDVLNTIIKARVKRVYKKNVEVYANLESAQQVKVFVTGFVKQPGLYDGMSSDSVLYYLDKAGGIDPDRGSFLDVRMLRNGTTRHAFNLYDFLLKGSMGPVQFVDGDTIVVGPRRHTVVVDGLVENPFRFEFTEAVIPLSTVLSLAHSNPEATNLRVVRNLGRVRNVDYYSLAQVRGVTVNDGDEVVLTADKQPGTIAVRVEGEHDGKQEFVLPYGATLGTLLREVRFNTRSNREALQLYRRSVKARQQEMLESSLQSLQASVLTARSATNEEATLRKQEADLVLQWIERAKAIEPRGQVVLDASDRVNKIVLENGDLIRVPAKTQLVMIHGEVLFPNSVVYNTSSSLEDYINQAGGYTQSANTSQVLVMHPDGSFVRAKKKGWGSKHMVAGVEPGDEILVLPKVDLKRLQITKDITQVMYQLALSAAVVLAL
jgi:protein involved in polysaccharide export with SLBB domain